MEKTYIQVSQLYLITESKVFKFAQIPILSKLIKICLSGGDKHRQVQQKVKARRSKLVSIL